jgi:hypothetical protein
MGGTCSVHTGGGKYKHFVAKPQEGTQLKLPELSWKNSIKMDVR